MESMNLSAPAQLLWDEAQHMRKRGHTKNILWNAKVEVCYYGSLFQVAKVQNPEDPVIFAASELMCKYLGSRLDPVRETAEARMRLECYGSRHRYHIPLYLMISWNNANDRTGEEVIAAMEAAALSADAALSSQGVEQTDGGSPDNPDQDVARQVEQRLADVLA